MTSEIYDSTNSKWEAYQFSDPFAANAFVCYNKKFRVVCRPHCDQYPKATSREEVDFIEEISRLGSGQVELCHRCLPTDVSSNLDLNLIRMTIESINNSIGFTSDGNDLKRRAFSTPSINTTDGHFTDRQLTRNESEHVKLVELACRHIASAAAKSYSEQQEQGNSKKKRRGGVLGFKELAAKSKLSPWHFHRVFKSVTGLTPKTYGEECSKFIKNHERPQTLRQRSHFRSGSDITSSYHRPKRQSKKDESVSPTAKSFKIDAITPKQDDTLPLPTHTNTLLTLPTSDGNKNSLDINMALLRHQSMDLGSIGFDFNLSGHINTDLTSHYMPQQQVPQFQLGFDNQLPTDSINNAVPIQQPVQDFAQPQLFSDFNNSGASQMNIVPNDTDTTQHASVADVASLTLNQFDDSQWPSIEASTPADGGSLSSKLLTPPSSVSEHEIKEMKQEGNDFYNVINNSPLDNDDVFQINEQTNYSLFNHDDNGNLLFEGEGQEFLNGVTAVKQEGDVNNVAVDLMI